MNTEIIEKYLLNQMSEEERLSFEKILNSDPELQKEFRAQKELMQAINRTAIKTGLNQASKTYILKRRLMQWGAGIIITATMVAISYYIYSNKNNAEINLRYETNELGTKEFADADKYLPSQLFCINNNIDTIIETKNGIVFAIKAHSFQNADGHETEGSIDVEVKEALNTEDILKAGLSTMSNNELLETGGMFYFNARKNGTNLAVTKEINASVPAREIKPGMKLFEGKRTADGFINWVNPVELDKDLTTFNITDLDFYPPNFIPALHKLGLDYKNKTYTDSLYFSFAGYGMPSFIGNADTTRMMQEEINDKNQYGRVYVTLNRIPRVFPNLQAYYDCLDSMRKAGLNNPWNISTSTASFATLQSNYEIDPSRIKSIWNEKFNNTILATKEFEERLKYLQTLCGATYYKSSDALLVYVMNTDKPLYYSDSLLKKLCPGLRFNEFYERHDGGVKIASALQQKLADYFVQRSKQIEQIGEETWLKIYANEAVKNSEAMQKQSAHQYLEYLKNTTNFKEEYDRNLQEACKQLNCTHTTSSPNRYNAKFIAMGWKNIDQYVMESTANRTSLHYIDPISGKTAEIKYKPFSVNVTGSYDRTLVYLIPHELSSFQRVKQDGAVFKENLNEFIKYDVVVLAYQGSDLFYHIQKDIEAKEYSFGLNKITQADFSNKLRVFSKNTQSDFNEEMAYQVFEQKEVERKRIQAIVDEQRRIIAASIFPCLNYKDSVGGNGIQPASQPETLK